MYCPSCGIKEDQVTQFCRTCGTDLRLVRVTLEIPDQSSASTMTARDEVARAVAAKVQEGKWWQLGAMVPEVERLFESPQMRELRLLRETEAQRLRRLRAGVITSAVGLGTLLLLFLASLGKPDLLLFAGPSLVVLLIGLGIVINGLLFTIPKGSAVDRLTEKQNQNTPAESATTAEIRADLPSMRPSFSPYSVTDQTTRHLSSDFALPQESKSHQRQLVDRSSPGYREVSEE